MTIQERLKKSNLIMLLVPVGVAALLLLLEGIKFITEKSTQKGVVQR